MYILVPMDSDNIEEASITKLEDVKVWTQLRIEDGELLEVNHNSENDEFNKFSETIVVNNDKEYVWPFMEKSMMVLVAHVQKSVDDIVEAYLFKELHDLAY